MITLRVRGIDDLIWLINEVNEGIGCSYSADRGDSLIKMRDDFEAIKTKYYDNLKT